MPTLFDYMNTFNQGYDSDMKQSIENKYLPESLMAQIALNKAKTPYINAQTAAQQIKNQYLPQTLLAAIQLSHARAPYLAAQTNLANQNYANPLLRASGIIGELARETYARKHGYNVMPSSSGSNATGIPQQSTNGQAPVNIADIAQRQRQLADQKTQNQSNYYGNRARQAGWAVLPPTQRQEIINNLHNLGYLDSQIQNMQTTQAQSIIANRIRNPLLKSSQSANPSANTSSPNVSQTNGTSPTSNNAVNNTVQNWINSLSKTQGTTSQSVIDKSIYPAFQLKQQVFARENKITMAKIAPLLNKVRNVLTGVKNIGQAAFLKSGAKYNPEAAKNLELLQGLTKTLLTHEVLMQLGANSTNEQVGQFMQLTDPKKYGLSGKTYLQYYKELWNKLDAIDKGTIAQPIASNIAALKKQEVNPFLGASDQINNNLIQKYIQANPGVSRTVIIKALQNKGLIK